MTCRSVRQALQASTWIKGFGGARLWAAGCRQVQGDCLRFLRGARRKQAYIYALT